AFCNRATPRQQQHPSHDIPTNRPGDDGQGDATAALRRAQWRDQSSAHRSLHERADLCLFGGGQLLQREGGGPHGAFVEVRLVAEAERRVPRFELLRALEEADDLAVLGIRGHPVPGSRREGWRAFFDDSMEPLAHGAIRFRHLGDLREHGAFPVFLVRLQLLDALPHRAMFLLRESLGLLAGRGGALGGLLRALLCRFHEFFSSSEINYFSRVHSLRFNQPRWALVGTARNRQSQHSLWDSNPFSIRAPPACTEFPERLLATPSGRLDRDTRE